MTACRCLVHSKCPVSTGLPAPRGSPRTAPATGRHRDACRLLGVGGVSARGAVRQPAAPGQQGASFQSRWGLSRPGRGGHRP